jgi:hypothetical protein
MLLSRKRTISGTQPVSYQTGRGTPSWKQSKWEVNQTIYVLLAQGLSIQRLLPPLPHTSSVSVTQLYTRITLCFTFIYAYIHEEWQIMQEQNWSILNSFLRVSFISQNPTSAPYHILRRTQESNTNFILPVSWSVFKIRNILPGLPSFGKGKKPPAATGAQGS